MAGIQIVGAGNNAAVKVNRLGRIQTESTVLDLPHSINLDHELAYVSSFTVTPSADSFFHYIKNNSEDPLIIESTTVFSEDTDEIITIYANPIGSPTGGETLNPINSNFGSNKIAVGTFEYGARLEGLTNGDFYGSSYFKAQEVTTYFFQNWIVLPRNTSMGLHARFGGSEISVTMPFFYTAGY